MQENYDEETESKVIEGVVEAEFLLKLGPDGLPLEPQPMDDPADPLNWSWTWKHIILAQVAFASTMAPYTAAGHVFNLSYALPVILTALQFHRSINSISYQVGIHVLGLACGNLLWTPLGNTYGRRPIYIFFMLISLATNIGGLRAHSYGTLRIARFIQGFESDAANATGASTIADLFFLHERVSKFLRLWKYPTTVG
ncbi:hypothetical protein M422DRAFT_150846 [Sphaerobolus stellatus SS14]|nr:hypothetical protein M422DRAFT_150846 [Sphaerobolus stellatus SS14]